MLTDRATINVCGGRGGSGCASFRREKHVPRGGPDGGNGGVGGDVVIAATRQVRDLTYFRHHVHFKGGNGGHGSGQRRHGRAGAPVTVSVPVGTEVRDQDGTLLGDLVREGQSIIVAPGGEGGRGNVCFVSSTRRAPKFAEHGLHGRERWLSLRLKLIADVGLVGLPNAGKSSLLGALTRAHPKIASYPFTTLEPNLGTLDLDGDAVVLADIPGLVEGASEGTGLGDRFLAHIERTNALMFVVDAALGPEEAVAALSTVRTELRASSPELDARLGLVALNKTDLLDETEVAAVTAAVSRVGDDLGGPCVSVSAATGDGLAGLVEALSNVLRKAWSLQGESIVETPAPVVLRPVSDRVSDYRIEREEEMWRVCGAALERLVAKADLDNPEAVRYLQEVMERAGLSAALRRAGGVDGDAIAIGEAQFELA